MQKLGQHFLTNKSVLKKIAGLLDLSAKGGSASGGKKGDAVIEIGPGHGELTEQILNNESRITNNGIKIIAIEKDENLAEELRKKFSGNEKIKIITGDILKVLPSLIENCKFTENCELKIENYKLIGNIPYYITGKLLRTIGELPNRPGLCVLTIQKEVAERLVAKPPHMNRLAASVQFWAEPKIAFVIPKEDFRPEPEIDSVTVVLKPVAERGISPDIYYKTVRTVFTQPRKTILNNISNGAGISKAEIAKMLAKTGIDGGLRPQNLSVEDIITIARIHLPAAGR